MPRDAVSRTANVERTGRHNRVTLNMLLGKFYDIVRFLGCCSSFLQWSQLAISQPMIRSSKVNPQLFGQLLIHNCLASDLFRALQLFFGDLEITFSCKQAS